jgi:predicted transcriptional regulator of viral defense system
MTVVRRTELLGAGYAEHEIRRELRVGTLVRVGRGAYLRHTLPSDGGQRHALRVRAAVADLAPGSVISHVSAAVLHGLPTWGLGLDRVHATRPRRSGGRVDARTHLHAAPLDPDEIVELDGIAVTAPARTMIDVARVTGFEAAVVLVDRALHDGLITPTRLAEALTRATRWPGAPAARRVVAFADRLSESVGESRSRVVIAAAGLPTPVLQWEVRDEKGTWLGRADFGWPDHRTLGEFDGRIKYGELVRPGRRAGDVVFAEKLREDALRAAGLQVIRWTWSDLDRFAPVAARLRRALR